MTEFGVINIKKFTQLFERMDFLVDTAEDFLKKVEMTPDDSGPVNFPLVPKGSVVSVDKCFVP